MFVTEPGVQDTHTDVDTALNLPATQTVQVEAPVEANVLVMEPAEHAAQVVAPAAC